MAPIHVTDHRGLEPGRVAHPNQCTAILPCGLGLDFRLPLGQGYLSVRVFVL
jgi:hypothetical protein